jgi:folate-binding protein YgfZ
MPSLLLHSFHQKNGGQFGAIGEAETVASYGDEPAEYAALRQTAGVLDFSFRSRLCLTGADRARFLHGQVTNDVNRLRVGDGCYAAITTAKGKMEADANIFCLQEELLLDLEPGLTEKITQRLEKYIVADDVQIVDVGPHYGLLTIQGPQAEAVVRGTALFDAMPPAELEWVKATATDLGEIYLMRHARLGAGAAGFDIYVPNDALAVVAEKFQAAALTVGGRLCGWHAFETARIEAGIPRYGADMDETNIPLECGLEARAITYTKGCYIGQEVINRIHSVGHVNRELRGLEIAEGLKSLPMRGDRLFKDGKEVGYITSATHSPLLRRAIALGYLRREANEIGSALVLRSGDAETTVTVVPLPFRA